MRRILAISMLLLVFAPGWGIDILGKFKTELRLSLTNGDFLFNEINGYLKFDQQINDNLYALFQLGVRYIGNPVGKDTLNNILTPQELAWSSTMMPVEILVEEVYFTYNNFITEGIDLTVGKQRINWGAADMFNPTDLMNAGDLSDFLSFGKKSPSLSLNMIYYFYIIEYQSSIQFVYQPYSPVARINKLLIDTIESELEGQLLGQITNQGTSFTNLSSGWLDPIVETPIPSLLGSSFGLRYTLSLGMIDLSANIVSRMNDLPFVRKLEANMGAEIDLFGGDTNLTLISKSYELAYYHETEVGLDFTWNNGFFVTWLEVGVFFPGVAVTTAVVDTAVSVIFPPISSNVTVVQEQPYISNQAYVKYTLGGDCHFEGGWYLNLQFAHGYFTERGVSGMERLSDFLIVHGEKTLFSDKLKLMVTGILNVNTWGDAFGAPDFGAYFASHSGEVLQLAASYAPSLDLTFTLGVMLFDGGAECTIGKMKSYDLVYTSFEYAF
ncbi:MAG: hypothetical protein A2Y33_05805 [Spirochaetes bacterium GWF1_51_8]|nr:MAG: hypothetical protein A2Y33_05805 [Spirochaetes bacterium GWF1_51_8]